MSDNYEKAKALWAASGVTERSIRQAGEKMVAEWEAKRPEHEAAMKKSEEDIKKLPIIFTDEVIDGLVTLCRAYGSGDRTEIVGFIQWCFETVGRDVPSDEQLSHVED